MMFNVSDDERASEQLSGEKLTTIAQEIASTGFAVVEGLVSSETCELLLSSVVEDAGAVKALDTLTPHEKHTGEGHLQLGLRRYAPYVRPDLVANPIIESIVAAVLGSGAWLGFYNGNVNLPGSTFQPLHYDRPFSWRTPEQAAKDGQPWPPPTTTLSCSVALTALTEDNGATEIYPGTHLETAVTQWPMGERLSKHPELVERWAPPARMVVPTGGICFRDPRMWHRGVPNPSDQTRPMIGMTYHAEKCLSWRGRLIKTVTPELRERCQLQPELRLLDDGELGDGRLVFEASAREAFTANESRHRINRNVRFVEPPLQVNHFLDAHLLGGARVVSDGSRSPSG